jgi:hypothetical protein
LSRPVLLASLLAALALVAAGCSGGSDAPPADPTPPEGAANLQGVGQPCETFTDCDGSLAKLCEKGKEGGLPFCTADCSYALGDDERQCGPNATCVHRGEGKGRCIPAGEGDRWGVPEPEVAEVAVPCCALPEGNSEGIGRLCATHSDCADTESAHTCPAAIKPHLPNWCTHLCDPGDDDACGPDAFCWWRPSQEGGMVGSCAPIACMASNTPAACPETAPVEAAPVEPAPAAGTAPAAQ